MFSDAMKQIKISFFLLIFFSILTGLIYPAFITLIAQIFFSWQANGSVMQWQGQTVGSQLIGQPFTDDHYFWGRPSATSPFPYNAHNSSGSNMAASNPDFLATVQDRVTYLQNKNSQRIYKIPVDLVTASGSGLDPDITPLAAFFQIARVAKARGISQQTLYYLIRANMQKRTFDLLGEPRVNVLMLNLALDKYQAGDKHV